MRDYLSRWKARDWILLTAGGLLTGIAGPMLLRQIDSEKSIENGKYPGFGDALGLIHRDTQWMTVVVGVGLVLLLLWLVYRMVDLVRWWAATRDERISGRGWDDY